MLMLLLMYRKERGNEKMKTLNAVNRKTGEKVEVTFLKGYQKVEVFNPATQKKKVIKSETMIRGYQLENNNPYLKRMKGDR